MIILIKKEELGLQFEFNGSHTVNVQHLDGNCDIDCFSVGSFKNNSATLEEFEEGVEDYIKGLEEENETRN